MSQRHLRNPSIRAASLLPVGLALAACSILVGCDQAVPAEDPVSFRNVEDAPRFLLVKDAHYNAINEWVDDDSATIPLHRRIIPCGTDGHDTETEELAQNIQDIHTSGKCFIMAHHEDHIRISGNGPKRSFSLEVGGLFGSHADKDDGVSGSIVVTIRNVCPKDADADASVRIAAGQRVRMETKTHRAALLDSTISAKGGAQILLSAGITKPGESTEFTNLYTQYVDNDRRTDSMWNRDALFDLVKAAAEYGFAAAEPEFAVAEDIKDEAEHQPGDKPGDFDIEQAAQNVANVITASYYTTTGDENGSTRATVNGAVPSANSGTDLFTVPSGGSIQFNMGQTTAYDISATTAVTTTAAAYLSSDYYLAGAVSYSGETVAGFYALGTDGSDSEIRSEDDLHEVVDDFLFGESLPLSDKSKTQGTILP